MRATEFITEQGVAEGSLNEWQEADLYHVTYIPSMLQMWHNDTMGLGGDVSTTRNYNYALGYLKNFRNSGGVIFTLDQNRLRRDIGRRRMPGTDWFKGEPPADSSDEFRRRDDSLDTDRFETLIKGGLKPFRKYVKKIQIWLPKKRTIKPTPPGEDPLYRHTYTPGDDPDQHYDVSVNDELMQNNWFRNPTMKATWDAVLRDPRTEVKSELGFQKTQHNVPVRARTQYGTDHRLYDPSKDDFREGLNEFAPGGQEGNGPFDYGSAIVQIGEDYTELYNDDGDGADAARIIKVGKTFMDAGMTAGINAFYAMDTMVRDHVAEQLQDLGFNVRQDIYLPYRQGIAKKTADSNAKYATHQATPAGQEEARNKTVIKAVIVSGSKNYQPGHEVASLIFDKRKQDVAQRLAEIKKEMLERFGPKVKIDYQVTIGGNPVQVKEQGMAEGFLNEGLAHPVIVVDVQPEYSGMNDGNESSVFPQIINFVNKQTGPVLMFVNAEDQGLSGDTIQDIKQYWDDTICPEEERYIHDEETDDYIENPNCPKINWQRFAIADKGYGYFRSWMDHGIEPATIVATIRELYQQKKSDSRELQFPAFNKRTPQQSLIMGAMQEMEDDPISVNWTSVSQLKRFNGAYIVGGARDQCLREVELLMNAFNIKYKRIDSLIYEGQQGVAEGRENFNGIDISIEIQKDDEYVDDEDYDNQVLYVTASSKGKELGHVLFAFDGEYLMPQDLEVEERYRGQGIAQTMYDYVKSKGYKIRRSGQQTDAGAGFWDKHKGPGQNVWEQGVAENFADGKGPGRPGDSQRHGIPKHATMAELEKASHAKGRKGQLARWQLNMRRGHKK